MSVLELKSEIQRRAEEEAARILEDARKEAEKLVAEARSKVESLREEKTRNLTRSLETEERAELAISRMDRKGEILQAKSQWSDKVFEEAGKRLAEMAEKGGADYRELLSKLMLEGIMKIKDKKFVAEVNSKDVDAIKKESKVILDRAAKMKNERIELEIKTLSTTPMGGVVISTEDKTRYYNNTLEARLSNARQNLTGEIHKIMFKAGE